MSNDQDQATGTPSACHGYRAVRLRAIIQAALMDHGCDVDEALDLARQCTEWMDLCEECGSTLKNWECAKSACSNGSRLAGGLYAALKAVEPYVSDYGFRMSDRETSDLVFSAIRDYEAR